MLARRHTACPHCLLQPLRERDRLASRLAIEEHDERTWVPIDELDEKRIVVGMDLAQRLRAEIDVPVAGKAELRAIANAGGFGRAIAHPDSPKRDELLGIVCLRVFRLHRLARDEILDALAARRDRMTPRRALGPRKAQIGEQHALRGHADIRKHDDVEAGLPHGLCNGASVSHRLREGVAGALDVARQLVVPLPVKNVET